MPAQKRKKANQKIKTLATRSVSASKAGRVKGGSPNLYQQCATGSHIKKAIIAVR